MRRRKKIVTEEDNKEYEIRSSPLWGILICGVIIICIGAYLYLTENIATGTASSRGISNKGPQNVLLNGTSTIIVGMLFCAYPAYELIRKRISGKNK